jgi:hypothetical protein
MSEKRWNRIDCADMVFGVLEIGPNEYSKEPISLTVTATSRNDNDMTAWLSPADARLVAIQLNKLADAAEAAGPI